MSTCFLNGEFMPLAEARISPLDRGFLFGDGVYEYIPVYAREPFRLGGHLVRLERTLKAIGLTAPFSLTEWRTLIAELVQRNPWEDQSVYIQISRGADTGRNHIFPIDVPQTVFMMCEPLEVPTVQQVAAGVKAISATDIRWLHCDLKVTALLANCLLKQRAAEQNCAEAVLFRDGFLTEGAASSIFVVKEGCIYVPPKNHLILPGITYDVILELAALHQQPLEVREITETEVRTADEIWMASSGKEVLAIVELDGRPVGSGRPGPLAERMHGWYQNFKREVMYGG